MKKYLIALGAMLAATLSLTNCAEEFQTGPDPVGTTYTIYANAADTKTVNDGFSTKWSDYDSLNVFHVESGSAWMSDNIKFTILDVEEGEFIAEGFDESALSEVNDWYVLYPYNPYVISPSALDESGYFALGGRVGRPQVQYGNDNMGHIGGNNYPMWAVAKELPVTVIPEVMMTHLTSLVEVVVANNSEVPMTVTSISFDAPENITGTYYIGIDEEEPYFVSSGDAYVSDVVRLTVKDGEPIEPGSSAKFYFAIKPFTAPAGETLSLSVNSIVKTFELTQDVVFSPGKVKTLNFNVDEYYAPEPGPYSSNMLWALGKNAYTEKAIVNDVENVSVLKLGKNDAFGSAVITIPAGTSKIGFYAVSWSGSAATLSLLKDSEVIGEVYPPVNEGASGNSPYYIDEEDAVCYFEIPVNAVEESDYVLETSVNKRVLIWGLNYYTADGDLGENQEPEKPEVQAVTVAEFLAAAEDETVYELTGVITSVVNTTYGNFYLKDETGEVYIYGLCSPEGASKYWAESGAKAGDTITVQTVRTSYKGTPQGTNAIFVSLVPGEPIKPEVQAVTVAEFLAAAEDNTVYELTGVITSVANTTYGNFYLKDETGEVYIYGLCSPEGASKYWVASGAKAGDTITVQTVRSSYNGTPQGKNAIFVSLVPGEPIKPEEPELTVATIAEFLEAEESTDTWYKLTGEITSIVEGNANGNLYINDGTGEVYIYGLTNGWVGHNDKSFDSIGLKVGDIVTLGTLRASYKGTPQGGGSTKPAYYICHEAGSTDLAPEMVLLVSDKGQKTWTYAPEFSYGNGGHSGNGSGFDNGAVDGQWWGIGEADELKNFPDFSGGVVYGDEANGAYMIFSEDGIVNTYDPAGKLIRGGNFEVKNYDPSRASGWEIGKLVTSEPALLYPWSINENGKGVTEYDLMYLTDQQMTLVYTKGNSAGSWGEITYWRFVAKGAE